MKNASKEASVFGQDDLYSDKKIIALYSEAEHKANEYNQTCLVVIAGIIVLCNILNEIGIFIVGKFAMRLGCCFGILFFMTPKLISIFTKNFSKGEYIAEKKSWFKYAIVIFAYLGVLVANVLLTHHTVLMIAIPIFLMAQYKNVKDLIPLGIVLSTICVVLGVYLGFFFGLLDANLVGVAYTNKTDALDFALRIKYATPLRMQELLLHYVIPREIMVIALLILASATAIRNNLIIDKQAILQIGIEKEMSRTNKMQAQVIEGMAALIENRDLGTGEHVKRTSTYVKMITDKLVEANRITEDEASNMVKAAPLHDIGKITISDSVLQKPGKLTEEEYEIIKKHSPEGERVVRNVFSNINDEDFLRIATEISGSHHERWDGLGYPDGTKLDNIPISARVMAVADVFDALISKRVYKEAYDTDKAFSIIKEGSGTQFDPEIVDIFLSLREDIEKYINDSVKE